MPHATPEDAAAQHPVSGPCSCPHQVPHSLVTHLRQPALCPPCTIQTNIKDIRDIQNGLTARGGIFVSRPRNTKKDMNHPEWKAHVDLRSRWRDAKIAVLNDVMRFEELAKSGDRAEGWEMLDEALRLWEQEAETLAEVPGYSKERSEEEVGEIVKRMMDELKEALTGVIGRDEDGDSAMEDATAEEEEVEAEVGDCPFPDSDVDTDSENEEDAMDTGESSHDQDSEDEAADEADEEDDEIPNPLDADMIEMEATTNTAAVSSPTSSTNISGRRVRFTEFAKISPETLNFVPSLFPDNPAGYPVAQEGDIPFNPYLSATIPALSNTPLLRHHRRRTNADEKRAKSNFRHVSSNYKPGRWASPLGYEKADTSCYCMDWSSAEMHWQEEHLQVEEEKKAFEQMKAISGTYVLTHAFPVAWWAYQTRDRDPPGTSELALESNK